ncbi:MAG: ABC transporter substrate-binding protein [Chloroflexi bacterium]|nr:ABC transporter substrate-binding protein [Chloroflexota bacterium]
MSTRFKGFSFALLFVMVFGMLAGCAPAATEAPTVEAPAETEAVVPTEVPAVATEMPAATEVPAATEAPAAKKVFTFGRFLDAFLPDPVMNDANADIWYMQQYYAGLVRTNATAEIEPELAESWEMSEDGLTFTYYLRKDLKFCDGSPITPEDWLWSLERARNPENGIWSFTLEYVDTITADEEKVVFTLKEPYVPFMYSPTLFNAVVMPKAQVEAAGGWENFMLHPCGAGPFIMKEWIKGDKMILEKNPYYWDAANVKLDEIILKFIPDDNARIMALQAGEVDAINYPPFSRVAELEADPNIEVLKFPVGQIVQVIPNHRNAPLNDVRVRQALNYAIDRQALVDNVTFGLGIPATTYRPAGTLYFNDSLVGWPYDPEKAKALLAEAGYPDGFTIKLDVVTGREQQMQYGTMLQAMFADIGVTLEIEPQEGGINRQNYWDGNFQLHAAAWTDDIPDPSQHTNYAVVYDTIQSYHSDYNNAEIQELAKAALTEQDPDKRKAMYWRIQEIHNEDAAFIPLWSEPLVVAVRNNVEGFQQSNLGIYIWRDLDIK